MLRGLKISGPWLVLVAESLVPCRSGKSKLPNAWYNPGTATNESLEAALGKLMSEVRAWSRRSDPLHFHPHHTSLLDSPHSPSLQDRAKALIESAVAAHPEFKLKALVRGVIRLGGVDAFDQLDAGRWCRLAQRMPGGARKYQDWSWLRQVYRDFRPFIRACEEGSAVPSKPRSKADAVLMLPHLRRLINAVVDKVAAAIEERRRSVETGCCLWLDLAVLDGLCTQLAPLLRRLEENALAQVWRHQRAGS